MGIKIVSQPIAAPIIAATATALGQAQEKRAKLQISMLQQEKEHKYNTANREAERAFRMEEADLGFRRESAARPMPKGVGLNPEMAKEYGSISSEERGILSGTIMDPRSAGAMDRLRKIDERKREIEGSNPDPSPAEEFDKGRIFLDPSGSRMGPDGVPYTSRPEGGSELWLDPKTGTYGPPEVDKAKEAEGKAETDRTKKELERAQKAIADQNAKTQKNYDVQRKRAEDAAKRKEKDILNKSGSTPEDADAIWSEFDSKWPLEAPGLISMPDTGAAAAPAPGAPPVPGAAPPAPSAAPPAAPVDPPAPAPGVPAAPVGGAAGATPLEEQDKMSQFDDVVHNPDSELAGMLSDVREKWDAMSFEEKKEALDDIGLGLDSNPLDYARPVGGAAEAAPQEQPMLLPDDIKDTIDRARATDPENAALYDEVDKIWAKPATERTEADIQKLYELYLRAQAAGLGMKE